MKAFISPLVLPSPFSSSSPPCSLASVRSEGWTRNGRCASTFHNALQRDVARPFRHRQTPRCSTESASTSTSLSPSSLSSSGGDLVTYTSLNNNGYALRYRDCTVVVDPWLYGDLVFSYDFVYRLKKQPQPKDEDERMSVSSFPTSRIDAIVLTQSIEDHAHPPTLSRLPKDIPVYASPKCRSMLRRMNFENVTYLSYDESYSFSPHFKLTALKGSNLLLYREYALLFELQHREHKKTCTVYHEPHGDHIWQQLEPIKRNIDILVSPFVDAMVGVKQLSLLQVQLFDGYQGNIDACDFIKPSVVIGFDNSTGEKPVGFLSQLLHITKIDLDALKSSLRQCDGLEKLHVLDFCKPMEELVVWDFSETEADTEEQQQQGSGSLAIGSSLGRIFDQPI